MPVTLSYDLMNATPAQRNYIRSMLERFDWTRLGGSVFRYEGRRLKSHVEEDWLNDVVPSLMFLRAYALKHGISIRFLTLDTNSVSRLDHSDPTIQLGRAPLSGKSLKLRTPTNQQSSAKTIRNFVDAATKAT